MKKQLLAVIVILTLATFACSISNVKMETVDPMIVMVNESLPETAGQAELAFTMTGGEFALQAGSGKLVEGTITYNVERWEPRFVRRENYLQIKQVNPFNVTGIPTNDIINNWDLALTNAIPLDLTIDGGAGRNTFDFTGLQLTNLSIQQGASDTTLMFNAPNPQRLETFTFTTGASSADLAGLGYANFSRLNFTAGAGDYTLDFSGGLAQDASVEVKATISNITIIIPSGIHAVVTDRSTVSNINAEGTWLLTDNTYATQEGGPTLTISLDMAVGNVKLVHESDDGDQ